MRSRLRCSCRKSRRKFDVVRVVQAECYHMNGFDGSPLLYCFELCITNGQIFHWHAVAYIVFIPSSEYRGVPTFRYAQLSAL